MSVCVCTYVCIGAGVCSGGVCALVVCVCVSLCMYEYVDVIMMVIGG